VALTPEISILTGSIQICSGSHQTKPGKQQNWKKDGEHLITEAAKARAARSVNTTESTDAKK